MSHVTATETEIPENQLDTLKEACKKLGLVWKEGQKTYKWFGKWMNDFDAEDAAYKLGIDPKDYGKCEHAIQVPGCAYEIGVYRHKETGNFRLIYDFYGSGQQIMAKIGRQSEILLNMQGECFAHKFAKQKGLKVKKRVVNGVVEMVLTK